MNGVQRGFVAVAAAVAVVIVVIGAITLFGDDGDVTIDEIPPTSAPPSTPSPTPSTVPSPTVTATTPAEPTVSPDTPTAAPSPDGSATTPAGPPAAPALREAAADAVAELANGLAAGDTEAVLGLLHPATLDRYGEDECRAYVEALPTATVAVEEVYDVGAWPYDTDGRSVQVSDVVQVSVRTDAAGGTLPDVLYLGEDYGALRWLADCGEPAG